MILLEIFKVFTSNFRVIFGKTFYNVAGITAKKEKLFAERAGIVVLTIVRLQSGTKSNPV